MMMNQTSTPCCATLACKGTDSGLNVGTRAFQASEREYLVHNADIGRIGLRLVYHSDPEQSCLEAVHISLESPLHLKTQIDSVLQEYCKFPECHLPTPVKASSTPLLP